MTSAKPAKHAPVKANPVGLAAAPVEPTETDAFSATVAERVKAAKAKKTVKAKAPRTEWSASTLARLEAVKAGKGEKLTVSDVRKASGSSWDRQTRDSLRRLAQAGLIQTQAGPPERFWA